MASELLINHRPYETRTALVENGETVEYRVERAAGRGLSGSIYKGRAVRVIPGLQAAFVDIGLEKAAFLYVDDLSPSVSGLSRSLGGGARLDLEGEAAGAGEGQGAAEDDDALEGLIEGLEGLSGTESGAASRAPIESLLSEGQELLVQVSKEPIGQKGARVTTLVSLPGRRLVLLSSGGHLGVSKRIESEAERARLRELLEDCRDLLESKGRGCGLIARTAAEGASDCEIKAEASFLAQLWAEIRRKAEEAAAPALIHQELDLVLRAVRDSFTEGVERLVVDDRDQHARVKAFLESFAPELAPALSLHEDPTPLFHARNVEEDLARAMSRKVWLKSGGYLVIDETEALTVIDVNTGRYLGRRCLEETILKTNLEAVREIAFQLRLRNIGGLIVIDFIDMEREASRERVTAALRDALRRDRGAAKVLPMSELGVVEMTRKRSRENIDRLLREPCFCCQGQGSLLTGASVCHQALRDLELAAADCPGAPLALKVHPSVRGHFLEEGRAALEDLERRIGMGVTVMADPSLHPETAEVEIGRARDFREASSGRPGPEGPAASVSPAAGAPLAAGDGSARPGPRSAARARGPAGGQEGNAPAGPAGNAAGHAGNAAGHAGGLEGRSPGAQAAASGKPGSAPLAFREGQAAPEAPAPRWPPAGQAPQGAQARHGLRGTPEPGRASRARRPETAQPQAPAPRPLAAPGGGRGA
jgi:ribonuclease G